MRVIRINTTAFEEEDFYLLTTLTDEQIAEVIQPIVNADRDGYEEYDNESIWRALTERFPLEFVEMYNEFETLEF
jgi:hypothetical protein